MSGIQNILLGGAAGSAQTYVDDVFSTYLYTGTGASQTITNGIDLAGHGGLVWRKARTYPSNSGYYHKLIDTVRGTSTVLFSNTTDGATTVSELSSFNSNGFTMASGSGFANQSGDTYASWTFRKYQKFFDIVTYTGNGVAGRTITHNLGVAPGMFVVKRTDSTGAWVTYHRSLGATKYLLLNDLVSQGTSSLNWNDTEPTSSVFTVGSSNDTNANNATYVAYLFAHDATADGFIQCGSFTGSSSPSEISIGWEPQWILYKQSNSNAQWNLVDNLRGFPNVSTFPNAYAMGLYPNTSGAEGARDDIAPTATGFVTNGNSPSNNYIYVAIRRSNKPPANASDIFGVTSATGEPDTTPLTTQNGVLADAVLHGIRITSGGYGPFMSSRLTGSGIYLVTSTTGVSNTQSTYIKYDNNSYAYIPAGGYGNNSGGATERYALYSFKRAVGVFDVVCWTGTGSARTVTHNLGVTPEMMIIKGRDSGNNWAVYHSAVGNTAALELNTSITPATNSAYWNNTSPTTTTFTVGTSPTVNANAATYVGYLFATKAGISKVGTYTGNGTSQTINCGFSSGARFVLIKNTSGSANNWVIFDSARGIVAGNDPFIRTNNADAQNTSTDPIDPDNSGFIVNEVGPSSINASSTTYVYLAFA